MPEQCIVIAQLCIPVHIDEKDIGTEPTHPLDVAVLRRPLMSTSARKTMRREDRAISIEDAIVLLESAEYGVLSMASPDGVPHGVPLNFALAGNSIYFHCAPEGRKIDCLAANKTVSFCVVGNTQVLPEEFGTRYESVIATGTIEELTAEDKREALLLLVRKYSPEYVAEGLEVIDRLIGNTKVFRIPLESVTGKARG